MRGITEERMRELRTEHSESPAIKWFIDRVLREECREIDPWQTIESAPKDRRILLFHPGISKPFIGQWFDLNNAVGYWDYIGLPYTSEQPTHWQELPPDPESAITT